MPAPPTSAAADAPRAKRVRKPSERGASSARWVRQLQNLEQENTQMQPKSLLTVPQPFSLLKAVEDLQTVTPRVYAQCEEFFQSTIAAAHGSLPSSSPRALLKKGISSTTSSSGFLLVGSSIMEHSATSANDSNRNGGKGSMSSSGVLVPGREDGKRGWDWRMGFGREVKGEDVLRILRLGLAKDVARA